MHQTATSETRKKYFWLASLTMAILLSSAILVPTVSAYADKGNTTRHGDSPNQNNSQNNNNVGNPGHHDKDKDKDNDKDDKHHHKDRKDHDGDKEKKCKPKKNGKYNKHCDQD